MVEIVPPTSGYVEITLQLLEGWSMISLPVIPNNGSKLSELFPDAVVVYCYKKGIGYIRVSKEDELVVGKGYWILLSQIVGQENFRVETELL